SRSATHGVKAEARDSITRARRLNNGADANGRGSIVVIGAGPTGLSATYHLGSEAVLLERSNAVGGECRAFLQGVLTSDMAGHIMCSKHPSVHGMYQTLLGDNVHWQDREAWIYSKNVYTRYPFQGCLYGLPADVIKECIMGVIDAHYGNAKNKSPFDKKESSPKHEDCCADGTVNNENSRCDTAQEPQNFEAFIYQMWGKGIAKHFAI